MLLSWCFQDDLGFSSILRFSRFFLFPNDTLVTLEMNIFKLSSKRNKSVSHGVYLAKKGFTQVAQVQISQERPAFEGLQQVLMNNIIIIFAIF